MIYGTFKLDMLDIFLPQNYVSNFAAKFREQKTFSFLSTLKSVRY